MIIRLIGDKAKSINKIFERLEEAGEGLSRSGLYYHLSELEEAGIIELAEYREVGGGAPEKVWRLKIKEIAPEQKFFLLRSFTPPILLLPAFSVTNMQKT